MPTELEEAARIDGLGRFATFWKIAVPLARPALGAVGIFTFLHSWNLYLEPIVFLSTSEKFTLPQALTQFVDAYGGPMWNVQLSAASLTAIPVLVRSSGFQTLSYVDGVTFARRATAPALFSAALMDLSCPPSTAYAAYAGHKHLEV